MTPREPTGQAISDGGWMPDEWALNRLGEEIEEWGCLNDRQVGTVGSYRLASHVVELLHTDPQLAAGLGLAARVARGGPLDA